MTHQLQQTSLFAYFNEVRPSLGERQQAVYDFLKQKGSSTNKEIAHWFSLDTCSITGRVKELREMGLVTQDNTRECKITGRTAISWKIKQ